MYLLSFTPQNYAFQFFTFILKDYSKFETKLNISKFKTKKVLSLGLFSKSYICIKNLPTICSFIYTSVCNISK